jgi:hypothetical protein
VELVRLSAEGESGDLVAEQGLPTELAPGAYELVLLSTMYGDTIDAFGNQTVLGEDARCQVPFRIDAGTVGLEVIVNFQPGTCLTSMKVAET